MLCFSPKKLAKTTTSSAMNPEKKLTERTFTGFLWMMAGSGVQAGVKIGVLAALARLVSPADFGVVGVAVIAVEFPKMFAHMGVGRAIVQRKTLENRHLTTGLTLSVCMWLFFAGMRILLVPFLANFCRMRGCDMGWRVVTAFLLVDS